MVAGFALHDEADAAAVTEICRRLDGIALAIELAAARMVSMSPAEVLERLTDRFRLLRGAGRGLERHQTLRQAVQWSFDLLDDDERVVLQHCSVFAGGFDLAAVTVVVGEGWDEYAVLDLLDSLVRKSLVTAERVGDGTRYGLLETIRQFAEEQLAATDAASTPSGIATLATTPISARPFDTWDGPGYRGAIDWVDVEFANLRAGFRWATDQRDLVTATAIAATDGADGVRPEPFRAGSSLNPSYVRPQRMSRGTATHGANAQFMPVARTSSDVMRAAFSTRSALRVQGGNIVREDRCAEITLLWP